MAGYKKRVREKQLEPEVIIYLRENCGRAAKIRNNAQGKTTLNLSEVATLAGVDKTLVYNLINYNLKNYRKLSAEIDRIAETVTRLTQ